MTIKLFVKGMTYWNDIEILRFRLKFLVFHEILCEKAKVNNR